MPQQAIFFDVRTDAKRVRVLKVYDAAYARSCFDEMSEEALRFLADALDLSSKYEMPEPASQLNWEDVEEDAREDGNLLSFFVVVEEKNGQQQPVYVSPDWPSAESFAKTRL
jgi:hypothetical protein